MMRLATVRLENRTAAVRVDGDTVVEIAGARDVGELLQDKDWSERAGVASGRQHSVGDLDFAPVVPRPNKIICVGLNYRQHILEVGLPIPEYPTLFAKFSPALIGASDTIELPAVAKNIDWEAELGLIIGAHARAVTESEAHKVIAGYTVANDISARDWQMRTTEWLQGKTFANTTPVGPYLVTADEAGPGADISCEVNGELMQKASTADLVFGPGALVSYISTILPLEPGNIILTGTPGGVGFAQKPPRQLQDGDQVVTRIDGIGECRNTCHSV